MAGHLRGGIRYGKFRPRAFPTEQCLDFETALASSTAVGRVALRDADAADLVLLDCDPSIIDSPEAMRAMPEHVLGTMLAGRWTYQQAE